MLSTEEEKLFLKELGTYPSNKGSSWFSDEIILDLFDSITRLEEHPESLKYG